MCHVAPLRPVATLFAKMCAKCTTGQWGALTGHLRCPFKSPPATGRPVCFRCFTTSDGARMTQSVYAVERVHAIGDSVRHPERDAIQQTLFQNTLVRGPRRRHARLATTNAPIADCLLSSHVALAAKSRRTTSLSRQHRRAEALRHPTRTALHAAAQSRTRPRSAWVAGRDATGAAAPSPSSV